MATLYAEKQSILPGCFGSTTLHMHFIVRVMWSSCQSSIIQIVNRLIRQCALSFPNPSDRVIEEFLAMAKPCRNEI